MEHYQLGSRIGKGCHGEVFKGYSNQFKCAVAVKRVAKTPLTLPFVEQEKQIWSELNHPNIVKLLEVVETEEEVIFVSEYVEGISLLNLPAIPSENEVKNICVQLLAALSYCFKKGFCHRDLKLENILYTPQKVVKLIDFGFACKMETSTCFAGTLLYAPPEVLLHKPYCPYKADLWSLGVLIFALLNGELPFTGNSNNEIASNILSLRNGPWKDAVSDDAIDFVALLLLMDAESRPSISQLLFHPWLVQKSKGLSKSIHNFWSNIIS